MKMYRKQCGRM